MRQGNGSDILGLNDPRNASIGVIYVSPNDERKSVLAAILTQERLGRKQVAIVLSDQNKAFRRPGDFDDLKSLRNKLQTKIVFIAPSGPGPAAFAHQRNFPVYPSLETYSKALKDEAQGTGKKGWLFGTGKQKAAAPTNGTTSVKSATKPESAQPPPPVVPAPQPQTSDAAAEQKDGRVVPFVAAAGIAADVLATNGHEAAPKNNGTTVSASPEPLADDNWQALSPVAETATPASSPMKNGANGHGEQHPQDAHDGPAIIELPVPKNKVTVKLPAAKAPAPVATVPVASQAATSPTSSSATKAPKQRNSAKVATVSAGAADTMAATSLARTAGSGSPPTTRNNAGTGGPGNSGRRTGALLIALAVLLVLTLGVCGGIAYSAPNLLGPLKNVVPRLAAQSTVTITPDSKTVNNSYVISGVQGNPDPTKPQVSARLVSGNSPTQSKTVSATGVKQTPATQAVGKITFYNSLTNSQTVGVTVFTLPSGVQVENNASVNVPAANPPTEGFVTVSAHAITTGSNGNIPANAIHGSCCANGITAFNAAFSGGQDAQNYTFVQQSDINGAVGALEPPLVQQAQSSLKAAIHSNEQVASSTVCTPSIGQNHNAGDRASSVTVSVLVTCKTEVYDQQGAVTYATNQLKKEATTNPGSGYALVGDVVTQTMTKGVNSAGVVSLVVSAKGIWAYQFSASEQQNLKKLIAGRSVTDAIAILKGQKGINDVTISPNSGTLPTNVDDINLVIQTVTGLHGGGTTPGGPNMTPTVTGPGSSPTTQPGLGGSSGGGS